MSEDDNDYVLRCIRGDREAFGTLVDRYQRPVFNAVLRMVRSNEDASDVTQQIFLKAYTNLNRFDTKRKFFSWLYRLAMNETINFLRSRREHEELSESLQAPDRSAEERLEADETAAIVRQEVGNLNVDHRAVIVLRHFLQLSYHEAAEVLDVPEKTVKSRLFSARETLRGSLLARGVGRGMNR